MTTKKQISIDKLNEHLFESIEMLKNRSDPQADDHEKMDIETAKTIMQIGKTVIDAYKVKVSAMAVLSTAQNPEATNNALTSSGILYNDTKAIE